MTEKNPFAAVIDAVVELAYRAGESISYHYAKPAPAVIKRKADGSLVTEADQASEAMILFGLENLTPDIPIVAEEQASFGRWPDITNATYWCVDPLDGTREFLNKTGEFCVCIGGIAQGQAVFGVLHAPIMGLTFAGVAGVGARSGAWRIDRTAPYQFTKTPLRPRPLPANPSDRIALVSRSHHEGAKLEQFLRDRQVGGRRAVGSAIKFGLVAAGLGDITARMSGLAVWDVAAGHAILAAAGGRVSDHQGGRLNYDNPRERTREFVAWGQ
ncbi:MAG: inositol monophosphatase family protein [Candidatus Symbiobacter sp.]|nr:inositol monophosphatase family protein [Candidatus Symbiobacter sp.]